MVDPAGAQGFLQRFPMDIRRRGEACLRGGQVAELAAQTPGQSYSALVGPGKRAFLVNLRQEARTGWTGSCTCGQKPLCEHLYATMCGLLEEHRTAIVRGLSAGSSGIAARRALEATPPPPKACVITKLSASKPGK